MAEWVLARSHADDAEQQRRSLDFLEAAETECS
jgi:hypothetical protein